MKPSFWQRTGDFLARRGFYIVLAVCLIGIGVSGYFVFRSLQLAAPTSASVTVIEEAEDPAAQLTQGPIIAPEQEIAAVAPEVAHSSQEEAASSAEESSAADEDNLTDEQAAAAVDVVSYAWPVAGEILTQFDTDTLAFYPVLGDWRVHNGVDLAAQVGDTVTAAASGTVTEIYDDPVLGTTVVIDHGDGLTSRYCNLAAETTVSLADTVLCGAVIGTVGGTAVGEEGSDSHLHFEMLSNGTQVDPGDYLPPR